MRKHKMGTCILAVLLSCLIGMSTFSTAIFAVEETEQVSTEQTMEEQQSDSDMENPDGGTVNDDSTGNSEIVENNNPNRLATEATGTDRTRSRVFQYIDENGNIAQTGDGDPVHMVSSSDHAWQMINGMETWYVVEGNVTIDGGVDIDGSGNHIKLLLLDDATLTIKGRNFNGGLNSNGDTISIYAQSNGPHMGKLIATAGHENWMAIGGDQTTVNIYGGVIEATEWPGMSGIGGDAYHKPYKVTINGGLVNVFSIGKRDMPLGNGSSGIYAREGGNAIVYTGTNTSAGNIADTFRSGILFLKREGTVYGDMELPFDLTIEEGETLTIPSGTALTIPQGKTLTVRGTLIIDGTLTNNGTVNSYDPGRIDMNFGAKYTGMKPANLYYQTHWDTDGDGTADDTTYVLGGEIPIHENGSRESDVQYTYVFTGWDPGLAAATEPKLYTAQFSDKLQYYPVMLPENPKGYTITHDGSTSVGYHQSFTFHVNITDGFMKTKQFAVKANDIGISPDINGRYEVIVHGETGITVEGVTAIRYQAVDENDSLTISGGTFMTIPEDTILIVNGSLIVDGTLMIEGTLINNGTIACNGTITNTGTFTNHGRLNMNLGSHHTGAMPDNLYYQIGWDTDGDNIVEEKTYVLHGETPTHEDGCKEADVQYAYVFTGWDYALVPATEPTVYRAQFSSTIRYYTVTLPENPKGYAVTTDDPTSVMANYAYKFMVEIMDNYMKTGGFAVKANGVEITPDADGKYTVSIRENTEITVEGVKPVNSPSTGDNSTITLWQWLLGISALSLAGSQMVAKKKQYDK